MKFLSTQQRLALVVIQDREAIRFTVPVELAIMIFWFLASSQARLLALVVWFLIGAMVKWYHSLCGYLAGWQEDLSLIRGALIQLIPDLLTIQVVTAFG